MRCDQCTATMIQGVFCHERGCPNTHSRYDAEDDLWIKQVKCWDCGTLVDEGESCCIDEENHDPEPCDYADPDHLATGYNAEHGGY